MQLFWSPQRASKGSLLIEVIASILVLSVGLLVVMQAYAGQRKSMVFNQQATQDLFLLSDHLGALGAGVDIQSVYSNGKAKVFVKKVEQSLEGEDGLKEATLSVYDKKGRVHPMSLTVWIEDENNETASFGS